MRMKLNKESKTILPLFLIIFVMILLTSGFKKGLIAVSAFLFCGATMIASIWLIALIIACILSGSIREAWIEMNPLALIKELCS